MAIPARAVTTSSGRQSFLNGCDDVLHVDTASLARRDPWATKVVETKQCPLGNLIGSRFDMVARMFVRAKVPLTETCTYNVKPGHIRQVTVRDVTVREYRGKMHLLRKLTP